MIKVSSWTRAAGLRLGRAILGPAILVAMTMGAASAADKQGPAKNGADPIDKQFVCPEAMANDAQRSLALNTFVQAFSKANPDATVSDMLLYRREMLTKHHCAKTLANLDAAESAVELGQVDTQAWLPLGTTDKGISVSVSMDQLKPYQDPRLPSEKAIEDYSLVAFSQPRKTGKGHVKFDRVISHEVYYCSSNQYALVANYYFLADKPVLTDTEPTTTVDGAQVYPLTNIPDGSLNQVIARWACGAEKGSQS